MRATPAEGESEDGDGVATAVMAAAVMAGEAMAGGDAVAQACLAEDRAEIWPERCAEE